MTQRHLLFCLLVLAPFTAMCGCTGSGRTPSPIYYHPAPDEAPRSLTMAAKDALVLARIKAAISSDDLVESGTTNIRVRCGVAILEGQAKDRYNVKMLVDLIRTVDGVVRVENRLNLKP